MGNAKGFTLIELMITVAVIAIITAIAVPQYTQYVVRGNRTAAEAFMMDVANRETQYLVDARTYGDLNALSMATPPANVSKYYNLVVCLDAACSPAPAGTVPYFKITATPVPGSIQASDGALTLDSLGAKTPATGKW